MKRSKDKFYMKQIFDCISDGEIIATGKIAKEIGLSEKSVRNRLNELSDFLLENNLGEIQRKPRVGIWLEANENQKVGVDSRLRDGTSITIGGIIAKKKNITENHKKFDAVYSIEENEWNGKTTIQLRLKDIINHKNQKISPGD